MAYKSQLYTCGSWFVKPGMEQSFIEAWQAFADWTSRAQPGAGSGILLQAEDDSQKFISFGPWDTAEHITDWRSKQEFQDFIAKARELCQEMKPQTMKVVGHSGPNVSREPGS